MKESTLLKKVEAVNELTEKFNASESLVIINPIGLTVAQVSELRRNLYDKDCEMHVIKNNIIRRAAQNSGYEGLDAVLVGPNAVALSKDATTASKVIYDFAKTNKKLEVKAGVVGGKVYDTKELKVLANLPDKNGMIAMLLSVLQAPIRNIGVAIKAVAEKQA
ncbi:MAG: 50S ribosomal protein L10 [Bacilli bacterium]